METIAFCEIEPYCQKVLAKHWPDIPIYEDVRNVTRERLNADGIFPDIITGGFPCQDLSVAGHQAGITGSRSGLWGEVARIIGEIQPKYAIMENVSALLAGDRGGWFGRVLGDLAEVGYDAEWHCIRPDAVGFPTNRDRVWICAYPAEKYVAQVVDPGRLSLEFRGMGAAHFSEFGWKVDESQMGRSADGVPDDVDRFEALGNSVYPQIPEIIGRAIMEVEK